MCIRDRYTSIAKYLNEQGIMSPLMYLKSLGYQLNVKTNGVWTKTTVKSILTNQAYIGSAVHGKVVIEKYNNIPLHATEPSEWVIVKNTYEPLVDKMCIRDRCIYGKCIYEFEKDGSKQSSPE